MITEHIAKGRYILDLTDNESNQLTQIAVAFYKGNKSKCIDCLIDAGLSVYKDLLDQGFEHDGLFRDSVKKLAESHIESEEQADLVEFFGNDTESSD